MGHFGFLLLLERHHLQGTCQQIKLYAGARPNQYWLPHRRFITLTLPNAEKHFLLSFNSYQLSSTPDRCPLLTWLALLINTALVFYEWHILWEAWMIHRAGSGQTRQNKLCFIITTPTANSKLSVCAHSLQSWHFLLIAAESTRKH